jgi:signal transduction histidine kinase
MRLGLIWTVALAALAIWRLARSSAPLRRVAAPVVVGGVVYLLLVGIDFAHSLPRGELSNDPFEQRLRLGEAAALCAIAFGVMWSWLRARRTRSVMARLVVELGESPPPGGLAEALAGALGDPGLEVAYPLREPERYVDARGLAVAPTVRAGRTMTPLARGGTTVAVLIHRQGLLDDPGLIEEVVSAARIALENERLQAEVRAQLEDLRASRARIVATGEAERRRLERDLHDGAQQRLVSLSLALRLFRAQLGSDPDPNVASRIDEAEDELRQSIDELREVAHGIYPAVLADEGLAAAVEALADRSSIPVRVVAIPDERLQGPVEAAAYFFIAEAIGPIASSTGATSVTVDVEHVDDRLLVSVSEVDAGAPDPDVQNLLVELADRVGALDGQTNVRQGSGRGFTLQAEIPCGS